MASSMSSESKCPLLSSSHINDYGGSGKTDCIQVNPAVLSRMIQIQASQISSCSSSQIFQEPPKSEFAMGPVFGVFIAGFNDIPDGQYVGEMQGNQPHGQGTATYKRDPEKRGWKQYQGEWRDGKFHGKGLLIFRNGTRYKGEWRAGVLHGHAVTFEVDQYQTRYTGEYVDGKKNGKGKIEKGNGEIYDGEWRDDQCDGYGKFTSRFGDQYEGYFERGVFSGQGTLVWANGDRYEGEWANNLQHGQGKMTQHNTVMIGTWEKGNLYISVQLGGDKIKVYL